MNLNIIKDKQYIYFYIDDKKYTYNIDENNLYENDNILNPHETILNTIVIEDIEDWINDKNYLGFFKLIRHAVLSNDYLFKNNMSIAEILIYIPQYSKYEQIYSAGLKVLLGQISYYYDTFPYTIKDIPKGLQKICRQYNLYLDDKFVKAYLKFPDAVNIIYSNFPEYKGLKKTDMKTIVTSKYNNRSFLLDYLINKHSYNIKDFINYLDYLKSEEKIRNIKNLLSDYYDYVKLNDELELDYPKYPKHFTESHNRTIDMVLQKEEEKKKKADARYKEYLATMDEKFVKRINKEYELEYGEYKFYYPKSPLEIEQEGKVMRNCVATYIKKVINGTCHILFLRYKDSPNKSLVTIEVRKNEIVQARRKCNSCVTKKDNEAIEYFNNYFKNANKKNIKE